MDTPRWHQRFDQFLRMLALLKAIAAEGRDRPLSDAEKAGLVQFFEIAVELGWKTLGDLLRSQLANVPMSPLPVIRAAFAADLIDNADLWMDAIERRNIMSHAYDASAFDQLVADAGERFIPVLDALAERLALEQRR